MIQKSILLARPLDQAFELFTEHITEWWPVTHRLTKDPESEMFLERTGRFWERSRNGQEIELGRVLTWEPPHRLIVDFYIGTSATEPTALEVLFTAEKNGTRITVHHRFKPESEELWNLRAPVFKNSWDAVLAALARR